MGSSHLVGSVDHLINISGARYSVARESAALLDQIKYPNQHSIVQYENCNKLLFTCNGDDTSAETVVGAPLSK